MKTVRTVSMGLYCILLLKEKLLTQLSKSVFEIGFSIHVRLLVFQMRNSDFTLFFAFSNTKNTIQIQQFNIEK